MVDEAKPEKLIAPDIMVGVVRLAVKFVDAHDGTAKGHATGFWVSIGERPYLVTNKHVVDRRLSEPGSPLRLAKLEVELRRRVGPPGGEQFASETKYFEVKNLPEALFVSEFADCAILADPNFGETGPFSSYCAIEDYDLATVYDFELHYVNLLDPVVFVRYPMSSKDKPWWDTAWTLPIAGCHHRLCAATPVCQRADPDGGRSAGLRPLVWGLERKPGLYREAGGLRRQ